MGTEIVKATDYAVVQQTEALAEVMEANVGGSLTQFDLDRITIPAGGGLSWTVPTLEGEESVKALEGIIVHWKEPRAYWASSFDESGGGTPPDCTSEDGIVGRGMFGPGSEHNSPGECATCPMSEFGSAPGDSNAQACKQMRVLFMVQPDGLLPQAVMLPPTSLKPMKRYFLRLAAKAIPYYGVVTRLELERATSGAGIKYSVVKPGVAAQIEPEVAARIKRYGSELKQALDAQLMDNVVAGIQESYTDTLED